MSRGYGWDGDDPSQDPEGIPANPWNYAGNLPQACGGLVSDRCNSLLLHFCAA